MSPVVQSLLTETSSAGAGSDFLNDVLDGLYSRPRAIPCKYLYDAWGSELFEQITALPEYYPTRTEIGLLERHGSDIAAAVGPSARVVEFGAGAQRKTRLLLQALEQPAQYMPVDIAPEMLEEGARSLMQAFPGLSVLPVVGDFITPAALPALPDGEGCLLGFFPGSTIGNLTAPVALDFLSGCADLLGPGGKLLIGVDLVKEPARLEAAYDDAAGVTAAFITNILTRINRELKGDFSADGFCHRARWNANDSRIDIHLESVRDQIVHISGHPFAFHQGEQIHIEHCHKYTVDRFTALAQQAGFEREHVWTDPAGDFSLHLLRCGTEAVQLSVLAGDKTD